MSNEYEIRPDHTVIFMDRRDGQRLECLIDTADLDLVHSHKWYAGWRKEAKTFYAQSKKVLMHRLIMDAPVHYEVDHDNHDGLDNRRHNLKVCTPSENCLNRRMRTVAKATSSTQFRGIHFDSRTRMYRAQVNINGMRREIPMSFESPAEAADALQRAQNAMFDLLESFSIRNQPQLGSKLDQIRTLERESMERCS